ncbi:uncharacterized protein LOC108735143 [Agrilus planipennis]|uniref:Uncharacterized protein LOC108735143 n=1 Tax=Agrilus planipennis TaxID=224129 RepID=A0A7F5R8Y6_AGRPL|nr:uncharacterized protein LOC108735143 [Agrilus planipennis]
MAEGTRRDIPIKLGDFSVIDSEFSNIRERFDAEMRKMEEEMSKFRSELMSREANNFFKSTTRSYEYEKVSGGNSTKSSRFVIHVLCTIVVRTVHFLAVLTVHFLEALYHKKIYCMCLITICIST